MATNDRFLRQRRPTFFVKDVIRRALTGQQARAFVTAGVRLGGDVEGLGGQAALPGKPDIRRQASTLRKAGPARLEAP